MSVEDGEIGIREEEGSKLWSVGRPRASERCPGIVWLNTASLEKWYLPARLCTCHPILFSSCATNMASYLRGPPLVQSSGGMAGKHWHSHTRRCDRSGLDL